MTDTPNDGRCEVSTILYHCEMGDVDALRRALRYAVPEQDTLETMLKIGVSDNSLDIVKLALQHGARDLHTAQMMAKRRDHIEIYNYLEMEVYHVL
jgi:hypothetical protein